MRTLFVPDRIVIDSNIHSTQRLYFAEQAPAIIPVAADIISSDAYGSYLDAIIGQSNQSMFDSLGLSFAGALMPADAVQLTGIAGGLGATPNSENLPIPACLFIDEAPPPADIFDDFDFYNCWATEGGNTGFVSPFDHSLSE